MRCFSNITEHLVREAWQKPGSLVILVGKWRSVRGGKVVFLYERNIWKQNSWGRRNRGSFSVRDSRVGPWVCVTDWQQHNWSQVIGLDWDGGKWQSSMEITEIWQFTPAEETAEVELTDKKLPINWFEIRAESTRDELDKSTCPHILKKGVCLFQARGEGKRLCGSLPKSPRCGSITEQCGQTWHTWKEVEYGTEAHSLGARGLAGRQPCWANPSSCLVLALQPVHSRR